MRFFIDFLVSKEFSSEGRQTGCGEHRPDASRRGLDLQCAVWELCRHMLKGVCRKSRSSVARLIFCTLIGFADGGSYSH